MENSGDILSSLLQNPEALNLIAGIAKSFLSANVNTAKTAVSTFSDDNGTDQNENNISDSTDNADNANFYPNAGSVSGETETGKASDNSDTLSAAVSAVKMLSGISENTSVSQSKSAEQPVNASAVIDAPHGHNSFDERANLLRSIKPYLKDDRRQKVDSLVKALNIAKLINSYTGSSGLFGK